MRSEEFLYEYNTSDYENTKLGEAQALEIAYSRIKDRKRVRVRSILVLVLCVAIIVIFRW